MEIWKDVIGYEGLYQVSNLGRVRSLDRYDSLKRLKKGTILKPLSSRNGYDMVCLWKDGNSKRVLIHRIVAKAFIPNIDDKPCIDHIDTNRRNNNITNLKWCTFKENTNNPLTLHKIRTACQTKA